MMALDLAAELTVDLLRSAWIIERARSELYAAWATGNERFDGSRGRAERRAEILHAALTQRGGRTDPTLVTPHRNWMESLAGTAAGRVALGDLFIARLGDWVEAHSGPFLGEAGDELRALGDEERAGLRFPDRLPEPPPFEPVAPADVEPPGEPKLRFGILADLHVGSKRGEEMARAAIDDLNRSGAELVIQLGDITDHGGRAEFELAKKVLDELDMPLVTMVGNHDVFSLEEERLAGRDYYPNSFGREPDGVVVEHKGFRFAVLDSAEHGASPFQPFSLVSGAFEEGPGGAIVRGSLTVPQHEILADVAAPGSAPAFVFLHHPPQPFLGFPPVLFGLRDADSARLHATCDSGNVWGVFAGHTHRNARTRDFGGFGGVGARRKAPSPRERRVPAQEVAIPRDYPFGYALVDVSDEGYAYRFLQISNEELLRHAYPSAGEIHRRYARGSDAERGFTWHHPSR